MHFLNRADSVLTEQVYFQIIFYIIIQFFKLQLSIYRSVNGIETVRKDQHYNSRMSRLKFIRCLGFVLNL